MSQIDPLRAFRVTCDDIIANVYKYAERLEHALGGREISLEETGRQPYGFNVDASRLCLFRQNETMRHMYAVAENAVSAMALCNKNDVPVIGILPENVWLKICEEHQLFTLWMNPDGEAVVSTIALTKAQGEISDISHRNIFGMKRSYDTRELLHARAKRKNTRYFFERRNRVSVMLDLFPRYGQTGEVSLYGNYRDGELVPVRFPQPPVNFGDAVLKLKKLSQRVAVVVEANAIDISAYITNTLADIDVEIARFERKRREANRATVRKLLASFEPDPILTFKYFERYGEDHAVRVIVSQYGKWPLELAAIKRLAEEDLSRID